MLLRGAEFYKIGIVVDDLTEAVSRYRELFDYEWGDGATVAQPFPVLIGDEIRTVTNRAVITRQKPRIHLIEATPGTPWEVDRGGQVHHLAYWVEELQEAARQITAQGYSFECGDAAEDPAARTWGYYTHPHGPRLELMRRTTTPEEWDARLDSLAPFVVG
ncbi:VOC family protein [Streptomyces muensis]|uniref:VOC family protein n=1 Tax=Streptomyces muensis TaxID=1077944 RepID=A0A9X1PRP4_STRM4|nr:VOC family protein [Streptomyces muensis]MCF1592282.1 VOC family protein [Streptomyces muensis]